MSAMLARDLPEARLACYTAIAFFAAVAAVRVLTHHMADQRRARSVFSSAWGAAIALHCAATSIAQRRLGLMRDIPVFGMVACFFLHGLVLLYTHRIGITTVVRLVHIASTVGMCASFSPAISVLGQPDETLLFCAVMLLSEGVGYLWWGRTDAAEPAAKPFAEPVAEPRGLAAAVELDEAATRRFTESHNTFIAFVAVAVVLTAMLAHELPEARLGCHTAIAFFAAVAAVRVLTHRMADQRRARSVFSWVWGAGMVLACTAEAIAQRRYAFMGDIPTGGMVACTFLSGLVVLYTHRIGITPAVRLVHTASNAGLMASMSPAVSALGQPGETFLTCAMLALGHLLSHTFDADLVSMQRRTRAEAQTREERARREREEQLRRRAEVEQEELRAAQRRQAVALERISDAVFEVHVAEWSADGVRAGRIERRNASFAEVFGPSVEDARALVDACVGADELVELLLAQAPNDRRELRFITPPGEQERTVHLSAVYDPDEFGEDVVQCIAHDLTDFKARVELEKDRRAIANLQHEEKNAHQAQEADAARAAGLLAGVQATLRQPHVRAFGCEPLIQVGDERTCDVAQALAQTETLLSKVAGRASAAQVETQSLIMVRQIACEEYVPVPARVDVLGKLREELGSATSIEVRGGAGDRGEGGAGGIPELMLDWNLLWLGVSNAVSNARKHRGPVGGGAERISIDARYDERAARLTLLVTNGVHARRQAALIAAHGTDGTPLLSRRLDGGSALSSNIGGQALLAAARLLGGGASLTFAPEETRLRLEVEAPVPMPAAAPKELPARVVYFLDDEETTRYIYAAWLSAPLDGASCRICPEAGLSPEAADESILGFARLVLRASPRPHAVLLDQNLASAVVRSQNVTTGTVVAAELRRGGYVGTIIIRSANVSRSAIEQYRAAGADAVLSKDEGRDALLHCLASTAPSNRESPSTAPPSPVAAATGCDRADDCDCADAPGAEPPLLTGGTVSELGAANAVKLLSIWRSSSRSVLDALGAAAADGRAVGLEPLLHRLCGQCEVVGAKRLALHVRAASDRLKREETFDYAAAHRALEALYAATLAAIDARFFTRDDDREDAH